MRSKKNIVLLIIEIIILISLCIGIYFLLPNYKTDKVKNKLNKYAISQHKLQELMPIKEDELDLTTGKFMFNNKTIAEEYSYYVMQIKDALEEIDVSTTKLLIQIGDEVKAGDYLTDNVRVAFDGKVISLDYSGHSVHISILNYGKRRLFYTTDNIEIGLKIKNALYYEFENNTIELSYYNFDLENNQINLEFEFAHIGNYLAGQFVAVKVVTQLENSFNCVPKNSIFLKGDKYFVYYKDAYEDENYKTVEVQVNKVYNDCYIIDLNLYGKYLFINMQ